MVCLRANDVHSKIGDRSRIGKVVFLACVMTATQPMTQTPAWKNAILQPAQDFGPVSLEVLAGKLPPGLQGSLYRNGPGRLGRNGMPVGHWFDGDGGVLGVHFAKGGATGVYRYVQTSGLQQEEQAGQYLFAGYGMVPPGPWWARLTRDVKNAANTSVLALGDRLLALWEGGLPHALTLDTLATIGLDDLPGLKHRPFSAHPKRDPKTGMIYNFGVTIGATSKLNVYELDGMGVVQREVIIPLTGIPLVHDWAIAGRYLIVCVPPVQIQALPVLARLKSFSAAMEWQPHRGTEIIAIDRTTLQVASRTVTDPWFQWHFGNGHELADGTVVIDIARYENFQTNQRLAEIVSGRLHTSAKATLWRLHLHPQTGTVISMEQTLDRSCEFPVSPPHEVGLPARYTYLSIHRPQTDLQTEVFDGIARFDHQTGTLTEACLSPGCYPNEPIYAADAVDPQWGWVLTVVYNQPCDRSEVWIFAADQLEAEPVCRLGLPHRVPLGFHGTWNPVGS